MMFSDLLSEASRLKCEESRARSDRYFEIVIGISELENAEALLGNYFGGPFKPPGKSVTPDIQVMTRPYGGVRVDQTFYFRQGSSPEEFAFLWPWSNGRSITLKIVSGQK